MNNQMIDGLVEAIAPVVRQFIAEQFASLITRIQALEAKSSVAPEMGPAGRDGLGLVEALIDNEDRLCIARSDGAISRLGRVVGRDGKDGRDGVDGSDGRGIIRAHVHDGRLRVNYSDGAEEDLGEIRGQPGPQGPQGESIRGERGDNGADGVGIVDVMVRGDTRQLLLTDGRELDLGRVVGRDGMDGAPGAPGEKGADGVSIADVLVLGDTRRLLLSDGRELDLGRVVGRDGADGAPGERGEKGDPGQSIIGPEGPPGKDADPEFIKSLVAEAAAAIPIPRDGEPGEPGQPGRDGIDGRGIVAVKRIEDSLVVQYSDNTEVCLGEIRGVPGLPGRDGKDADPQLIKSLVAEAVASIPPPKDGRDGIDGKDGSDADATKAIAELYDRITQLREQMSSEVSDAIGRAVAENAAATKQAIAEAMEIVPRNMLIDDSGDLVFVRGNGSAEKVGRVKGEDGATPVGIERFTIDSEGNLVAHMTDGRSIVVGRVKGADGKDGAPGLGFEDLRWEFDGERTLTAHMERGGQVYSQSFTFPAPIYRGVWREGEYQAGDSVTRDGGLWVARRATNAVPGGGSDTGWQLAVKGAKNGRSAFDIWRSLGNTGTERDFIESLRGAEGKPGIMGPPGRDR